MLAMSDDRPASVADIVVEELRKKEINGPIRLPKRDFFTRGRKLKVKDPWHILSGYDLEFAGMSTRERVRVMLEWFGRRQTIALPINSVVGCPDCNHSAWTLTLLPFDVKTQRQKPVHAAEAEAGDDRGVAALFAHSRERGNPIFRRCLQKGDGSPLARGRAGGDRTGRATEAGVRPSPFPSIRRNDLVAFVVDHDVVVRAERIMIFRGERPREGLDQPFVGRLQIFERRADRIRVG